MGAHSTDVMGLECILGGDTMNAIGSGGVSPGSTTTTTVTAVPCPVIDVDSSDVNTGVSSQKGMEFTDGDDSDAIYERCRVRGLSTAPNRAPRVEWGHNEGSVTHSVVDEATEDMDMQLMHAAFAAFEGEHVGGSNCCQSSTVVL